MKRKVQAALVAALMGALPAVAQESVTYVAEPHASVVLTDPGTAEAAKAIAEEINADASLKNAKLTVQAVEGGITLTGVTLTHAQMRRAVEIAQARAGVEKVVNAITSNEVIYGSPPPPPVDTFELQADDVKSGDAPAQ